MMGTIDDATKALTAERDENTCRKEMTFSELLPLKVALEELERPKAEERKAEAGRRYGTGSPNLGEPVAPRHAGETKRQVAKALGKSASTMDKVAEVHEVATAPDTPEPVRQVAEAAVKEMDRTGKVDGQQRGGESRKLGSKLEPRSDATPANASPKLGEAFQGAGRRPAPTLPP